MKLLSILESKDTQKQEVIRKLLRIQEVEEMTKKSNSKLAKAEMEFNTTLALNRTKWALEEEEYANRVKDMTQEVEALEKRKEQALVPIQMYKDGADKMMEEAREILQKSKEKDEQSDFLQEKLEEKLTELADREIEIVKTEQKLEISRNGILSQREQIKLGSEQLSKEIIVFHNKRVLDENNIDERKKEVALAEINFNAKTEKYSRDLEALRILEIQLKDERDTLDREYKRSK